MGFAAARSIKFISGDNFSLLVAGSSLVGFSQSVSQSVGGPGIVSCSRLCSVVCKFCHSVQQARKRIKVTSPSDDDFGGGRRQRVGINFMLPKIGHNFRSKLEAVLRQL